MANTVITGTKQQVGSQEELWGYTLTTLKSNEAPVFAREINTFMDKQCSTLVSIDQAKDYAANPDVTGNATIG